MLILEKIETIIIGKTQKARYLTLVINPIQHSLITIWPSNIKERRFYFKKFGGDNEKYKNQNSKI